MDSEPPVQIALLGTPVVECEGEPVVFKRRKSYALVSLAATERRTHSRESIMAFLWPDSDQKHASALLRTVLWEIRHTGLARIMDTSGRHVGIPEDAPASIDIATFQTLTETHREMPNEERYRNITPVEEAAALYRGPFLDGFHLPGSNAFEEWIQYHRDLFQRRYIALLNDIVRACEMRGEFDRSIEYARRLLSIDEMDESVHRDLMRLYALKGERARAMAQYESCISILKRELDVEPESETESLIEEIRAGRLQQPSPVRESRPPSRIPEPATAFIGREKEITDYHRMLLDPSCRLLTLTGLGGSGKTRLAIELAGIMSETEGIQVVFVSLTPMRTGRGMLFALTDALSLSHIPRGGSGAAMNSETGERLIRALIRYLHARRMVIVLDNFEHLLEHGRIVDTILTACPGITILITSRERTGITGEWVREISGLSYPESDSKSDDETAYDSTRLFLDLARRVQPDFNPDHDDIRAINNICRMVDGLPLGIELAVPWLQTMTCSRMAREIESNIDLLETRHPNLRARHRSLRAIFDQTWAILEPEARSCFRKLSVFRGGFSSEAAGEVTGATPLALTSLAQRSLVRFDGRDRFEILEVIRQFALERLTSVPRESETIGDRHARYYLRLLAEMQSLLKGSGQARTLRCLTQDMENIRAAWKRAVEYRLIGEIEHATFSLFLFYDISSRFVEGAEMFKEALSGLSHIGDDEYRPLLDIMRAAYAWFIRYTDMATSERVFNESIAGLADCPDDTRRAFVLILSTLHTESTPTTVRVDRLKEGRAIYAYLGDVWGEALALEGLAYANAHADPHAAYEYASQSLSLRQSIRDTWGVSLSHYILGYVLEFLGKNDIARRQYEKSAGLRNEIGQDQDGTLGCLLSMARIDMKEASYERCEQELVFVKRAGIENGLYLRAAQSVKRLIILMLIRDEHERAWLLSHELLDDISRYDMESELASVLVLRGDIRLAMGDPFSAQHLYDQALELRPDCSDARLGCGMIERQYDSKRAYACFHEVLSRGDTGLENDRFLRAAVEMARSLIGYDQFESAVRLLRYVLHHPRRSRYLEDVALHELNGIRTDCADRYSSYQPPRDQVSTLEQILSMIPRTMPP